MNITKLLFLIAVVLLLGITGCGSQPTPAVESTATAHAYPPPMNDPDEVTASLTAMPGEEVAVPTEEELDPGPTDEVVAEPQVDNCVECHTDQQTLIDTADPIAEIVSENEGEGGGGSVAPLEPWEKVLVDAESYLRISHGTISCATCHAGSNDAEGLTAALVESPDMIVIDARTPSEVEEKGTIDTSDVDLLLNHLEEFVAQKDIWPADLAAQITVYCGSGHRSTMALTILGTFGYTNVSSLKGGFRGWAEAGYPVAVYAVP